MCFRKHSHVLINRNRSWFFFSKNSLFSKGTDEPLNINGGEQSSDWFRIYILFKLTFNLFIDFIRRVQFPVTISFLTAISTLSLWGVVNVELRLKILGGIYFTSASGTLLVFLDLVSRLSLLSSDTIQVKYQRIPRRNELARKRLRSFQPIEFKVGNFFRVTFPVVLLILNTIVSQTVTLQLSTI